MLGIVLEKVGQERQERQEREEWDGRRLGRN